MRKRKIQHTTPANRSVFYDLGFDEAEARVLAMRPRRHAVGIGFSSGFATYFKVGGLIT